MAYLTQLPIEVLDIIIIMLAMSTNGAREIATISATCRLFRSIAAKEHILREVNFHCLTLTDDFSRHHHLKDLILLCTQTGNKSAKNIFAKALLFNDRWFQRVIAASNKEALLMREPHTGLLDSHSIVRSFIQHGCCKDIARLYRHLTSYVVSYVNLSVVHRSGIVDAISCMCSKMGKVLIEHNNMSVRKTVQATFYPEEVKYQMHDERKKVLVIFDQLFPSGRV